MASEIKINFKKFLPVAMQETRWGEFMEAYQSTVSQIKQDKIDVISDQFDKDLMTETDYQNLANNLGWSLSIFDGWCETEEYQRRECETIATRVYYKTTRKSFLSEAYCFNLFADVFPLSIEVDDSLTPLEDWQTNSEAATSIVSTLDAHLDNVSYYQNALFDSTAGVTWDALLWSFDVNFPVYEIPQNDGFPEIFLDNDRDIYPLFQLDQGSSTEQIVRQFIFQYEPQLVEDADYFLSVNSMRALRNDINQIKRKTEKHYMEPKLTINYGGSGTVTNQYYDDFYGNSDVGEHWTFYSGDLFNTNFEVQFGDGSYSNSGEVVSGVSSPVLTLTSGQVISEQTADTWYVRKKIYENSQIESFSEVALVMSGVCFLYSTFPMVYFTGLEYSNASFDFVDLTYV